MKGSIGFRKIGEGGHYFVSWYIGKKQYKVNKYVKIAPNFRIWNPKADGADNKPYGYISAIFSL